MARTVGIVGYGHVGKAMKQIFPNATIYDKYLHDFKGAKNAVNRCALAIVCVPTPEEKDGTCDISQVEEVVAWLETPLILIKSSVVPGTTDYLKYKYNKRIVFSPEYYGESSFYLPEDIFSPLGWPFLIIGGDRNDTAEAMGFFSPVLGPNKTYRQVEAITAELTKYMDNSWLAAQVTFSNEFYDIAQTFGVDYLELRELWGLDPRVSKSHTMVFEDKRGFGGKCLPKDLYAIIMSSCQQGYTPHLLKAIREVNARIKRRSAGTDRSVPNAKVDKLVKSLKPKDASAAAR